MEVLADHALARRLERAEASAGARFVEARRKLFPASGATWMELAGAYALYDGVSSPVTQTFGLGMFKTVTPAVLDQLEAFFQERGAPVDHDVSPLADNTLWPMFCERGYVPIEHGNVMFLPLDPKRTPAKAGNPAISVRVVQEPKYELWARTAVEGWKEVSEFAGLLEDMMRVGSAAEQKTLFLAELNGGAIGAGALNIHNGVALLAGASTIPEARKLGAQRALLQERLRYGAQSGCDLAMIVAEPGSASQRNAERQGFRIAYTRTKWRKGAIQRAAS